MTAALCVLFDLILIDYELGRICVGLHPESCRHDTQCLSAADHADKALTTVNSRKDKCDHTMLKSQTPASSQLYFFTHTANKRCKGHNT